MAIIEEFGPRFAPGATLLYLGDTENKTLVLEAKGFEVFRADDSTAPNSTHRRQLIPHTGGGGG